MHSVRSAKSYYVAAFILGAVIALLIATPARSAETFRLDRVSPGGDHAPGIYGTPDVTMEISGALQ